MYLYVKNKNKSISVYSLVPDQEKLIELKKRYVDNIKSVRLFINNQETEKLVRAGKPVTFNMLDKKEISGKITHIDETNNKKLIAEYINGTYDELDPIHIEGNYTLHESVYSGRIDNRDCTLLIDTTTDEDIAAQEGILLTGLLGIFQSLFSGDINNFVDLDFLEVYSDDVEEFLKLFKCKKQYEISFSDLESLHKSGLISFREDIDTCLYKSSEVIERLRRLRKTS